MPSAGGPKHSLDIRLLYQASKKCQYLDSFLPLFLFLLHLCLREAPPLSFVQTNFTAATRSFVRSTFLLTPLTAQCYEDPEVCDQSLSSQTQLIKFHHNLWSICIEKKSLSLPVDTPNRPPLRPPAPFSEDRVVLEEMQKCLLLKLIMDDLLGMILPLRRRESLPIMTSPAKSAWICS